VNADAQIPTVSFVIVSYNKPDLLRQTLDSIRSAVTAPAIKVIVVDNASPDGNAAMVATEFPDVQLIRNPRNDGFGAGCNIGAAAATGEYLLFVNSDVLFHGNPVPAMLDVFRDHPDAGIVGCGLKNPDGSTQPTGFRFPGVALRFIQLSGLKRLIIRLSPRIRERNEPLYRAEIVSGAFFMIRSDLFRSIGGFDSGFFMYVEDADLCMRVARQGKAAYVMTSNDVTHMGAHYEDTPSPFLFHHYNRGLNRYARKHFPGWKFLLFRTVNLGFLAARLSWVRLFRRDRERADQIRDVMRLYLTDDSTTDNRTPGIWVISELYYPEQSATGYYLTGIAEGLAQYARVRVVCAQPTYVQRGLRAPRREERNGVEISRVLATTLSKDNLASRAINILTISTAVLWSVLSGVRAGDMALVVTNPPTLPFIVSWACRMRGASCVLLTHDVFPEALVAAGILGQGSLTARILYRLHARLYRRMDRIIVLGRDMADLVARRLHDGTQRLRVIPNWADADSVQPASRDGNSMLRRLELLNKFVLQYSGNMGRTHGLEGILEAAVQLREQADIHFLLIGDGAKRRWVQEQVVRRSLTNVTLLPWQPREELAVSLNACDLALVSFVHGMAGVSVPSRIYNILAAGKPVLAVADESSELARVVREDEVGWVVRPEKPEELVAAIRAAKTDSGLLTTMGKRARASAESKHSFPAAIKGYLEVIREVAPESLMKEG